MTTVQRLNLSGFRNLKNIDLIFPENFRIFAFVGKNGQGKTNLLESLYLCSLSKSFRSKTNTDFIHFEETFCRITVQTSADTLSLVMTRTPSQKVLKVNEVKRPAAQFIGHLKSVFFSPDDLAHMAFAPKLRRRYLDVFLSQLSPPYLHTLMAYEEARRQRNALLKKIKEGTGRKNELMFWDDQLSTHGFELVQARLKLLEEVLPLVQEHYQQISESKDEIKIFYASQMQEVNTKEAYMNLLQAHQERDVITGKTHLGPHVDDLSFYLQDKDMHRFASRGEWRSLVLSLKFAEIDLIRKKTGDQPILLLDDVFSELDEQRQKYLFKAIGESQTFITTTHEIFFEGLENKVYLYKVEKGQINYE